jgi:hypothetical protein
MRQPFEYAAGATSSSDMRIRQEKDDNYAFSIP